jgi:putative CocE/NonD family hydrolase
MKKFVAGPVVGRVSSIQERMVRVLRIACVMNRFRGSRDLGLALAAATLVSATWGKAGEPAPHTYTQWTVDKEIFISMRDGVRLSTDVWLPKGALGKLPTVLVRTPYNKEREVTAAMEWRELWLKHGYAVVIQNERGRYFSEGEFKNYLQGASTDGYDSIHWITHQPWSNGKVGMLGCSSSGETQWLAAASNPPGLAAVIPGASGTAVGNIPGNNTRGKFYRGGVPAVFVPWAGFYAYMAASGERLLLPPDSTQEQRIRLRDNYSLDPKLSVDWADLSMQLPSGNLLRRAGVPRGPWDNYITRMPGDARWNEVEHIGAGATPHAPALHLNTWHDVAVGETTRLFKYLQDMGTPDQYLIIGAGPHCLPMLEKYMDFDGSDIKAAEASRAAHLPHTPDFKMSDLRFGDFEVGDARYDGIDQGYAKLFLRWFGHWLSGEHKTAMNMPKVQLYVMHQGWISGDHWPLKNTRPTTYYLTGRSDQVSDLRGGELSAIVPSGGGAGRYIDNPGFPVPSLGGGCCEFAAAVDQRSAEVRQDVLTYSTPPLDKPVTIAGPVDVVLYVSSSAKDTDFIVRLIDVYPDGKAINLDDDAFRVRYREGFDKKVLMQPGTIYRIDLPNMVTAIRFPIGHRIRLDVSSTSFPLYERNLNTGGNNYDETAWVVAENSIHYGGVYPSRIILPVLPD